MRVIITGGSGLIGRALTASLTQDGHEDVILSRTPRKVKDLPPNALAVGWDGETTTGWGHLVDGAGAIVNLAGENISGEGFFPTRWTDDRKQRILNSRTNPSKAIVDAIEAAEQKPEVLIQFSAVGYYGPRGDEKVDEDGAPGDDFLAQVLQEWEETTQVVEELGVRRAVVRLGVVLSTESGAALPRQMLPFKLFAGGPFGSGRQYLSWIHMQDLVSGIRYLISNKQARGVFNLTSPNPVTNAEFGKTLGKVMHRPYYLPVPGFAMRAMFGEVTTVVLDGQRVIPKHLQEIGYEFQFPGLEDALRDTLSK
jgi:uncharacterized protein (TIGR01777 family)